MYAIILREKIIYNVYVEIPYQQMLLGLREK